MTVGIVVFELHIPYARSLKEKRSVVKSLRDRLQRKFRVSVAEIGHLDLLQRGQLAVTAVSNGRGPLEKLFASIEDFVEISVDGEVVGWDAEYLQY